MQIFQIGETVTCKATVKRNAAVYDPVNSVKISIYIKNTGTKAWDTLVTAVSMTKEEIGIYTYDYQTTSSAKGEYRWHVVADDGVKISIQDASFKLEE